MANVRAFRHSKVSLKQVVTVVDRGHAVDFGDDNFDGIDRVCQV